MKPRVWIGMALRVLGSLRHVLEAGRIKRSVDSFGAEATFAYDASGNLLTRVAAKGALGSNPNYSTNYVYDELDQLITLTWRQQVLHYQERLMTD